MFPGEGRVQARRSPVSDVDASQKACGCWTPAFAGERQSDGLLSSKSSPISAAGADWVRRPTET